MEQNPMMWIMKADPGKYLRKPATTIAVIMKAIEGLFCLLAAVRVSRFLQEFVLFGNLPDALSVPLIPSGPLEQAFNQIQQILPGDLLAPGAAAGGASGGESNPELAFSVMQTILSFLTIDVYTGTIIERIALTVASAALLLLLLGIAVEGALLLILRFTFKCSGALKLIQRIMVYATAALLASAIAFFLFRIYSCVSTGLLRLPVILVPAFMVTAVLLLELAYARSLYAFYFSVDYEIRMEFKDTDTRGNRLGRNSVLLCLLFLAATIAIIVMTVHFHFAPATTVFWVIGCFFMCVKYFAVYQSFWAFQWCHK